MWTYKFHRLLQKLFDPFDWLQHFILDVSWTYAHYKNGWFAEKNPNSTYFRDLSFWEVLKGAKVSANNRNERY